MRAWWWSPLLAGCVEVGMGQADARPDAGARSAVCGSGTFGSIQEAVDAAAPGDTIEVCPGTWAPFEVRFGQDVRVVSTDGRDVTSIDAGPGTAVTVAGGKLELRGFRLTGTGGSDEEGKARGGAITVEEGDLTLADCVIEGTSGPFALVFDENLLLMEDVVWRDNDTRVLWFLWEGEQAVVTRNVVLGGVHQNVVAGGELTTLRLTRSVFAGIRIDGAFTAFDLRTSRGGPMVVENNVFYDIDELVPGQGRLFEGDLQFTNNVLMASQATDLAPFTSSFSLFWDNGVDYAPFVQGDGNLFVDPLLRDPENGDFCPRPDSPLIDAGHPDARYADPDGSRADIGRCG